MLLRSLALTCILTWRTLLHAGSSASILSLFSSSFIGGEADSGTKGVREVKIMRDGLKSTMCSTRRSFEQSPKMGSPLSLSRAAFIPSQPHTVPAIGKSCASGPRALSLEAMMPPPKQGCQGQLRDTSGLCCDQPPPCQIRSTGASRTPQLPTP